MFLKCLIQKKTFNSVEEDINEQFVITKNNWGYFNIYINSDVDFIDLSAVKLTESDFSGNRCVVKYSIKKDKLHLGVNLASITVTSGSIEHIIQLEVRNTPMIV